ncbi:MAG: UPF0182 family protein [Myxococcota bacterium]
MRFRWWTWGAAIAVLSMIGPLTGLITDGWWFASVGYGAAFRTVVITELGLGLVAGLIAVAVVGGSARFSARWNRPRPPTGAGLAGGFQGAGNPLARTSPVAAADAVTALIAVVSAIAASRSWPEALQFVYGGAFGWVDPVWSLDAGFYVFQLGLLVTGVRWLGGLIVVAAIVSGATYVALGTVRIQLSQQDGQLVATGIVMPPEVQRHLASLAAALLATMAILAYLARYTAMSDPNGLFAGPGYADLHATLPLLTVQAVGTAVAAFAAAVAIGRGSMVGFGVVAVGVGLLEAAVALVPGMVQRFSVLPNELSREAPQIRDHIAASRYAWALDVIDEHELSGQARLTRADIERNRATTENVRLWDHEPLLEAFSQVQEIRTYYGFVSVDNDRYWFDGEPRQIMLSPRELTVEQLPTQARTWVNETMIYTHGYGVALGPVNEVGGQGLPELWVRDLPPQVTHPEVLRIDRPELYFGEAENQAVIVGTRNAEFDYPSGDDNAYTRYEGADGVRLGWLGRLLFAIRLGSTEVLLSGDLDVDSKVILYRNVVERARRIAPFLTYDADPYLVIDQGRLVWVLDAYTASSRFPYAAQVRGIGNYARNPIKVTVDAYDGTTRFYRIDEGDPIAAAWAAAFPDLFLPATLGAADDALPPSLRAHLRVPIDLFATQAALFATYHMVDPQVFYNREDEWEVPAFDNRKMDPYFTVMKLPGEDREEFILMLPLSPRGKPNLAAWMVGRSDGAGYGQLRVYKFPKDTMVYGPRMVAARINQDDAISEKLSLWNQQGSQVLLGTLLVIPIEESLVYVQPLYLRASQSSIPELKRVIVAYEDRIAMAATLDEGLDRVFGGSPGRDPGDLGAPGDLSLPPVTAAELIRRAGLHWDAAQDAMKQGDWVRYGTETTALGEVLGALRSGLDQPAP